MSEKYSVTIESRFKPTDRIPEGILREFQKQALEDVLHGEPCRILGKLPLPSLPENILDLPFNEQWAFKELILNALQQWLQHQGLYAHEMTVIIGGLGSYRETEEWHRDGIASDIDPHKDPKRYREAETKATYLKLVFADRTPTQIRLFSGTKTLILTEPNQVVALNNRLVEHRTPPNCDPARIFISVDCVIPNRVIT